MAKIKNPMSVHWDGKMGGIVGYQSRGQCLSRSGPHHFNYDPTQAQLEASAKLVFISKLIAQMGYLYQTGYRWYNTKKSQRANFAKAIYENNAVTGNIADGFSVDYEKVLISRGNLLPTYSFTASVLGAQHRVSLSWTDNSGQGTAEATDRLAVMLYNASKGVNVYSDNVAVRSAESGQITYPTGWAGDTVYTYAFFYKPADTSLYKAAASPSVLVNFFVAE